MNVITSTCVKIAKHLNIECGYFDEINLKNIFLIYIKSYQNDFYFASVVPFEQMVNGNAEQHCFIICFYYWILLR